jgi:hypothetical protein
MTTPTKPPRLPKGSIRHQDPKGNLWQYSTTVRDSIPVAVIPCKTAREAKQVVRLHGMKPQAIKALLVKAACNSGDWSYSNRPTMEQIALSVAKALNLPHK